MASIPALASDEQKSAAFKWLSFFTNGENTAFWSIYTGYIAVRQSALNDPTFKTYSEQNPQSKEAKEIAQRELDKLK